MGKESPNPEMIRGHYWIHYLKLYTWFHYRWKEVTNYANNQDISQLILGDLVFCFDDSVQWVIVNVEINSRGYWMRVCRIMSWSDDNCGYWLLMRRPDHLHHTTWYDMDYIQSNKIAVWNYIQLPKIAIRWPVAYTLPPRLCKWYAKVTRLLGTCCNLDSIWYACMVDPEAGDLDRKVT